MYLPPGKAYKFSESFVQELEVLICLLPFFSANLAGNVSEDVYCSDASLKGYALHVTQLEPELIRSLGEVREAWRFRKERVVLPIALSVQTADHVGCSSQVIDELIAGRSSAEVALDSEDSRREKLPGAVAASEPFDLDEPVVSVSDTDIIFGSLESKLAARGLSAFGDASVTAVPTEV